MTADATTVTKLDELFSAIGGYDDPRRAGDEWKQIYRLLQKAGLDPRRFQGIVGMRDVASLGKLIDELRDPATADAAAPAEAADPEVLKKALLAFKKRAKLTRLDDESKLGRSPLTKGGDKSLAAITPPFEWPPEIWKELVYQGKLRYIGHGFYELPT